MKKKISYTNEPMNFKEVKDFLPAPEHFAFKEKNVKVTITLSQNSVDFFKKYAKKSHGHYQTMIRKIIDYYVMHHAA
ncbi:MAG TPA: CopG family transcriptional regulator [Elusimicrobia bacterium]|nr:MAG: CopG family transcriptional regulator [Elusimicrobia bacterium RIFOXYA12_FULL_49_49]OGS07776.1 MAG: CopG family transcriptional regulator [Elusimicrobia bacterium RIFOXYA1_FULL_47_7]OGS09585.1 MAG: CopG family transcriptional regulator [Elusimicrobia bacterium RIFOXYB1_FULL_48_9]OGS15426.1 MAG: CopG family transcriptional regulator [Elusimicrobia bacterium RIFOXYA2_FULL_47_53]OGS30854.1 MAG: CopG family transcriptional regulator [Elusimicrobia bacterium RIFOXYB2_FULL_46_23]HBU69141.1 C